MSVSGAGSLFSVGTIDVNSLVSQLMTVEAQPLTQLQQQETQVQSKISAYGQVASAMSTLQSAMATLRSATTFGAVTPTVTGSSVTAVAGGSGSGSGGNYTVAVTQLARSQSSASVAMDPNAALGTGALTITNGTTSATFNTGATGQPATLADLRNAINANTSLGVRASVISDGSQVRLVLNSAETGTANAFTVGATGALSSFGITTQQTAQDAQYSVNGLALTSSSNSIDSVVGGVTMTLASTGTSTVSVAADTTGVSNAVKAFVDAYNAVNSKIKTLTAYDASTKTAAVLNGESVLRQMQSQLRNIVGGTMTTSNTGDYTVLSSVGVQFQSDGSLSFNTTAFNTALSADPDKVARLFTSGTTTVTSGAYTDKTGDGFAVRLNNAITAMLDNNGMLGARTTGLNSQLGRMKSQETDMQSQLALKQQRLVQQYSALNAQLETMNQQGSALANALAALPK